MVKRAATLLLALLACLNARAGDYRLWLTLPDQPPGRVELGRPFNAVLRYRGPADLDNIVTEPWQDTVHITRGYAQRQDDGTQRLRLRLTPRRTGPLRLPPLRLGSAQSDPAELQVGPASEQGQLLQPAWSVSGLKAWQREEIRVNLVLDTTDPEARVQSDEFNPAGFAVQALPPTREALADEGTRHRFSWLLRPLGAGEFPLLLPRLRYIRDGVPRRRFHFPPQTLSVRALPPYVTPTVPVGRITLDPSRPGRVHGLGVDAAQLATALDGAGLPAHAAAEHDPQRGTVSEARIAWRHAAPKPAGLVYFDVTTGRLRNLVPQPPDYTPAWLAGLVGAGLLVLLGWRRKPIAAAWVKWRYRRRLRKALGTAMTAGARTDALLTHALPGQRDGALTLSRWLADYERIYRPQGDRRTALRRQVAQLQAARFGSQTPSDGDGEALRAAL